MLNFIKRKKSNRVGTEAKIIPRSAHCISRANISENALKVLYRLKNAGYAALLVGGGVRDLLLGQKPKDFDVVTNAHPEQIRKLFRNCILIGRRFRLAHIRFGREVIEVATFRATTDALFSKRKHSEEGMLLRDNVYGTIEEDVWRRDFTANALYYDIKDFSVVDYVGGMEDLQQKTLRIIGDPTVRYREDPVRMLRALRFAAKLGFSLEAKTAEQILALAQLLENISPARLFEEALKWFQSGKSLETFELLQQYKIFPILFPQTAASFIDVNGEIAIKFVRQGFANSDQRIQAAKSINPAFMYAVLWWWPLQRQIQILQEQGVDEAAAWHQAISLVLDQDNRVMIPHRLRLMIKEIWLLQEPLLGRRRRNVFILLEKPRFRAAFDFLLLRAETGETVQEQALWWEQIQVATLSERREMLAQLHQSHG